MIKKTVSTFFLLYIFTLISAEHDMFDAEYETNLISNGVTYIVYKKKDIPLRAHVVRIDPGTLYPALFPAASQRETVLSIAQRSHAVVAINGANYRRGGCYNGNRVNLLKIGTFLYADPRFTRGSLAFTSKHKTMLIDMVKANYHFTINTMTLPIYRVNQPSRLGESIIYNSLFNNHLILKGQTAIVIHDGIVKEKTTGLISSIAPNEYVYMTDDNNPSLEDIKVGMTAQLHCTVEALDYGDITDFDFVLGGAGLLLKNGTSVCDQLYHEFSQGTPITHCHDEIVADFHPRAMQEHLIVGQHPRTAIGIDYKGALYLVVIDGRQETSVGMTLEQLADFMQKLGCVNALNLGGGGCSTLVIKDTIVNTPCQHEDRPVSEALCFF